MRKGFTLIELSIVLVIIATVIGGGLALFASNIQQAQYKTTVARMDAIEKALLDYSVAFNRIPCPSDLTATSASANYGVEASSGGSCSGAPSANNFSMAGVAEGGVPTRTLRLPDSYMYDAWGHRFRYAVDPSYTNTLSSSSAVTAISANDNLPPPIGGTCGASSKSITVNDINGAARSSSAIYVLVSHGANGHGGFSSGGTAFSAGSTNTDEQTNCHCNSSATAQIYCCGPAWHNNGIYVQEAVTYNSASLLNSFDDIVSYKEAWQMRTAATPAVVPACLFVASYGNNALYKYTLNTATWSTLTDSFNLPYSVVYDSSGNLYVADASNNKIKRMTSSGTWSDLVTGLNYPDSIVIDSSNNLYVTNWTDGNIKKYNTSGALLSTLNDGAVNQYDSALDSSSNVWTTDWTNSRLQKYNGASWTIYGSAGTSTTAGQFNQPTGITYDPAGYLWISDWGNHRVQRCNTAVNSCTTWGGTGSGTNPGQFNNPREINLDKMGNVWVADDLNNRIQVYSNGTWNIFSTHGPSNVSLNRPFGVYPAGR